VIDLGFDGGTVFELEFGGAKDTPLLAGLNIPVI